MNRIKLIKGDITKVNVDAIVNAANASLMGGGGVDGAIHLVGGSAILEACKKIIASQGRCLTGKAVITTAGRLPAKWVIHTVGPIWKEYDVKRKDKELSNCYLNSLKLAVENSCESIAFPNISSGIYDFPKDTAADIAISVVKQFLEKDLRLKEIVFVCFDDENYNLYFERLKDLSA